MKVAWFSPLPPAASGIADYSSELIERIKSEVELQLITDNKTSVVAELRDRYEVLSVDAFSRRGGAQAVDLCLYQLGNNPDFHAYMLDALERWPGVVVLHEFMLHHLIQGATLARGDAAGYVDAMRYAYGEIGVVAARRLVEHGLPLDMWAFPLFERVVDVSRGLIVHSEAVRRRVLRSRPSARIIRIPHHLSLDALPAGETGPRAAGRRALGLPEDAFVVGSFGLVTPQKRLDVVMRAFTRLRRRHPEAVLLVAGEISPYYDASSWLPAASESGVVVTGRLELPHLLQAMAACDVAVNLRHPTGGETSGTLMRLLGIGRPVIVTSAGAFAEIPAGCCAQLPLDSREEDLLVAYLSRLAEDPALREAIGASARDYMHEHHDLRDSARLYVHALQEFARPEMKPFRPAPPLLPVPEGDLSTQFLGEIGWAMADLGADERDRELLLSLTEAAAELDLIDHERN
jgi:glycosyltransferase involved in cell wall biosynthesis